MNIVFIEQHRLEQLAKDHGEGFVGALIAAAGSSGSWSPLVGLHIDAGVYETMIASPATAKSSLFDWRAMERRAIGKTRPPVASAHPTTPPPEPGPGTHLKALVTLAATDPVALIREFFDRLGGLKMASLIPLATPLLKNREELAAKFHETLGCGCSSRARQMDAWGVEGCKKNMDVILGWLRDACQERGLPWDNDAARAAVEMAIERSNAIISSDPLRVS